MAKPTDAEVLRWLAHECGVDEPPAVTSGGQWVVEHCSGEYAFWAKPGDEEKAERLREVMLDG